MIWKMAEEPLAKRGKFYKSNYQDKWATLYPIGPANENSFAFYIIPCKKKMYLLTCGLADVNNTLKEKLILKWRMLLQNVAR